MNRPTIRHRPALALVHTPDPAQPFLDVLAEMVAADVVRELRERERIEERPRIWRRLELVR